LKKAIDCWNKNELRFLEKLNTPLKIQEYLDRIPYNTGTDSKSPRYVMKKKNAHCFEGAIFAAACLEFLGHPPLIVDMRAENDDDHLIAVFKANDHWGAIAKSNFTTLRFREPVYKTLRELSMSYFDFYFNTIGQKTLRAYSAPYNLSKYNKNSWKTTTHDLEYIGEDIDKKKHHTLINNTLIKSLTKVRPYLIEAGLIGSEPRGLYQPLA